MDNLTLILEEFNDLKGQFVIAHTYNVMRLIAIAEDEFDYYYVLYTGRKLEFHSCVGRIIPLKGFIKDKDYEEIERIAHLNNIDLIDNVPNEAKQEWRNYLLKITDNSSTKYITDIIWENNN